MVRRIFVNAPTLLRADSHRPASSIGRVASTLVADYRFARRPRRYPRREIAPAGVLERLAADLRLGERRHLALTALLRAGEPEPLRHTRW